MRTLMLMVVALLPAGANAAADAQRFNGRTAAESSAPRWPQIAVPPAGAPNVLLIMTDDVGFGSGSTFGGPIPTPTLDALARRGLRYNRFHTTAICSTTRAALLTGRNSHNVGMGNTTNNPTGYDGYTSVIPKSAASVAQILKESGYNTAMFGKGHVTPEWEMSQAGPFDRWPTGLGFEYFYGFLGADTSLFDPALIENTTPIGRPREAAYHLEHDLADRAIHWLQQQHALAPSHPFFVYYATAAAHAPNHAPQEWLAKFRGQFDEGWDVMRERTFARQKSLKVIPEQATLSARPSTLPAWSSLSADQKRLYARFMEAYAASLAFSDHEVGRIIDSLRAGGQLDDTLIIFIEGDNGASTEGRRDGRLFEQSGINGLDEGFDYMLTRINDIGGPSTYPLNTGGWGWAMNAPYPWYKRIASHLGGTRTGMVIAWPKQITDAGGIRAQFHHVSDVMPTILDAAGVTAPAVVGGVSQKPLDGISMRYTFAAPEAPDRRTTQVFEMFENLGLYHDGWMVSTRPVDTSWDTKPTSRVPLDQRVWELYDLRTDFSQTKDLARANPGKLAQMQQLFWVEAARNNILPIHSLTEGAEGAPTLSAGRTTFTYSSGITSIPENAAPHTMRRSFSIVADVVIPDGGAHGVLVAHGGQFGGYAFYIHEDRAVFHYNAIDPRRYTIRSDEKLSAGAHRLVMTFTADPAPRQGGGVSISIDGRNVASGRVEQTLKKWISHTEGFDVGVDTITAVSPDYVAADSRFTGDLQRLTLTLN